MEKYFEAIKDGKLAAGRKDLVVSFDEFKELVRFYEFRKLEREYLPAFVE